MKALCEYEFKAESIACIMKHGADYFAPTDDCELAENIFNGLSAHQLINHLICYLNKKENES